MPENNQLKETLESARAIHISTFKAIHHAANGEKAAALEQIQTHLKNIFAPIDEPTFFDNPPIINLTILNQYTKEIESLDALEIDLYIEKANAFILFMEIEVTHTMPTDIPFSFISDWNMKTLNALMKVNREVADRKRFFLQLDPDLPSNPEYDETMTNYHELRPIYTHALIHNIIESDASDVKILNKYTTILPKIEVLLAFLKVMKLLNKFITGKLPAEEDEEQV